MGEAAIPHKSNPFSLTPLSSSSPSRGYAPRRCAHSPFRPFVSLIGSPQRKRFTSLEAGVFAVIKRHPAFVNRSTKRAAVRIFFESQPFEWAQKLGGNQLNNEAILIAESLCRKDGRVNGCHKALRTRPRIRPRGVMEYWSMGVLRQVRIAVA